MAVAVPLTAESPAEDVLSLGGISARKALFLAATVVLLVVSMLFSFYLDTLVALLGVFGWGTFAASIFPAVVLGLVWPRATRQGAIASIIIGLLINFVLEIGGLYGFSPLPDDVVVGAFALAVAIARR